jgi:hypothetical protein
MFMLFALDPEDLGRIAVPIGIGIGVILILVVPSFRRGIRDSYTKGKKARERRLPGKKMPEKADSEGKEGK